MSQAQAKRYPVGSDPVADEITTVLVNLLFDRPFYGQLAMHLPFHLCSPDPEDGHSWCKTLATDGRRLYFNRDFVKKLSRPQIAFGIGHLLFHCLLHHLQRRGHREEGLWHNATDYVANANLIADRLGEPIEGALIDKKYNENMTAEEVYEDLKKNRTQVKFNFDEHLRHKDDWTDDDGQVVVDIFGDDAPPMLSDEDILEIQRNITRAMIQAAQAAGANGTPAIVRRMMDELTAPKMDWRSMIDSHIRSADSSNYCDNKMSRYEMNDVILPGIADEEEIIVHVGVDTSGSMTLDMQQEIMSEVKGIMTTFGKFKLVCWSFDTAVHSVKEFDEHNIGEVDYYAATMKGGGGTDFMVVWDWMKEKNIEPHRLIIFTDGYPCGSWGDPDYCETLFVVHGNTTQKSPFGETAYYDHTK